MISVLLISNLSLVELIVAGVSVTLFLVGVTPLKSMPELIAVILNNAPSRISPSSLFPALFSMEIALLTFVAVSNIVIVLPFSVVASDTSYLS